jgi:hypothetical protein
MREDGVIGKGGQRPQAARCRRRRQGGDPETGSQRDEFKKVWLTKGAVGKVDGKDMTHDEAVKKMSELYELRPSG